MQVLVLRVDRYGSLITNQHNKLNVVLWMVANGNANFGVLRRQY